MFKEIQKSDYCGFLFPSRFLQFLFSCLVFLVHQYDIIPNWFGNVLSSCTEIPSATSEIQAWFTGRRWGVNFATFHVLMRTSQVFTMYCIDENWRTGRLFNKLHRFSYSEIIFNFLRSQSPLRRSHYFLCSTKILFFISVHHISIRGTWKKVSF